MGINSNPFSLEGKRILVTGASSGIGLSTAIEAAKLGAHIVLVARNESRLNDTFNALPGECHSIISADLTDETAINRVVDECGMLDGAVFCAGKGLTLPLQFSDRARFDDLFNINFFSPAELLRLLYKKKKLTKGASVVLISSMGGTRVFSGGNSIYGASKAALDSFMKFAAKEFAARNVRVNSICPAMIDTPFIHRGTISDQQLAEDAKRYPLKRYGRPEDVAYAAVYLLSPASAWVTGTSMIIDGGLSIS